MKTELLYVGFEPTWDKAQSLGKFHSYEDVIDVAMGYASLDDSLVGNAYSGGYMGVDTRRVLVWPGHIGWICIHEVQEGQLELVLHNAYSDGLSQAEVSSRDYTRFMMNLMASGLPFVKVVEVLDASKSDQSIIELELKPLMNELKAVFEIIQEQLERVQVGDPVLRRRVEQELQGAVSTFYNQQPFEVQLRIWDGLSELIEQDRRFNNLTRLQAYRDLKVSVVTPEDVKEALAWIIDYAYGAAVIVPMWDAVAAGKGAEYIAEPDASIRTIGVLSQLGKLTREDPEFTTKVVGIMAALSEDKRFDRFMEDHPGVSLWRSMHSRLQRLQGDDAANARLSWPLYQLLLQYALAQGLVK